MYLGFVARIVFALVFLVAAGSKLRNPAAFRETIREIGIGSTVAQIVAWLIILYEAVLGVLYVLGIFPLIATLAAVVLLALFAGVSIKVIRLHQEIACNCFGESEALLGSHTLVRALFLTLPVGCYYFSTRLTNQTVWPTSFDILIVLCSLAVGTIVLAKWLLASMALVALISERQQYERRIGDRRRRELLQELLAGEGVG